MTKIRTTLCGLILLALSTTSFAQDFQSQLKAKSLILSGATCAGLKFNAAATAAAWQNEMDCSRGHNNTDAWRITWLAPNIFVMTEVTRSNYISPPRNDIYKIQSIKGKEVTLINYWTGWGNGKPETQKFRIK